MISALSYSGVVADHTVFTHVHAMNKTKEVGDSPLRTFAQPHDEFYTSTARTAIRGIPAFTIALVAPPL